MKIPDHNHTVLESSHIGRLLMKLSVPMMFGSIVQSIYSVVDTIFIGHIPNGKDAMAGLSIIFPIQMLTMGVASMVSVGGASLISRLIGGGDRQGAERALGNSIFFSTIFAVIFTLVVLPGVNVWLRLIGASSEVMPCARIYIVVTVAGTVFSVAGTVLLSLVRAEGNARVNMIFLILQNGLNIVLDYIFMIPMHMGIKGAALAIVISQAVAVVYIISYYLSGNSYLKIRWRNFIPDIKIVRSIFAIGISQFAQTIATAIAATAIIKMASTYGGDTALSTFGIIQRVLFLSSTPAMVLGQAMQPILGFNYGAKRYKQALQSIKVASLWGTGLGVAAFAVLIAISEPIARAFTSDPQLVAACSFAIRRIFVMLPLFSFFNVGQQVFPSIGQAVPTFIIAISRPLLFITPLVIFLPRLLGLNGVWLSFPISDFLCFVLTAGLLVPLVIKLRKAVAENKDLPRLTESAG
jgi:putative MATE family efflux protein